MKLVRRLLRGKGFWIACILAAWAGVEVGGKGTGLLTWLFAPGPTREQGKHPLDLIGARPKGPVRLTQAEAKGVQERLLAAFGGTVPAHWRTSAMGQYYRLHADASCQRDDLVECNKVEHMEPFFAAVLGAMHPATEHLLWKEIKSYEQGPDRGQLVRVAIFAGSDGRAKLAFDLRRVKRSAGFATFTLRTLDAVALKDLVWRDAGEGILVVEDPGPLQIPPGFVAAIHIYGGINPPDHHIVSLLIEGDVAARHKFLSAVLGAPVEGIDAAAPGSAYGPELEPQAETLFRLDGVRIRPALLDTLGERAARARFSRVKAKSGRGNFYGVIMDGARYLAVSITDPAHLRRYEFFWDGPDGLKAVAGVTQFAESESRRREGGIQPHYLIPVAEAGSAERLVVFRRGERGAPIAGLWPLAKWLAAMEAVFEADAQGG